MISQAERIAKRDNLYWNYRYRKGSYKARKSGLQPLLMVAKRGGDKIRVYGEPSEAISSNKIRFATSRFKAWRQKERELRRLERQRNKASKASQVVKVLAAKRRLPGNANSTERG